ncbi:NADP-reducing hydrogenase subunit HndC [Rubripirellula lacrimiformis]|uniref:NADP-reducing hydrogenase subunit HndC n=1 Tax=Rubripirellula lacrimiformis TaxID=1930273 RepID=A0A517NAN1_9BACT|nr:cyclic nucleotide-binding domain-containing protein [Rubripirellula lacrimiformis]QDT04196.1 NADP-reducing hydrogenase subunit HndC [Rubripirellula lacrimiformis]
MSNASDPSDKPVSFDVTDLVEGTRPDDEGLFARDVDGQLIRVERATASELDEDVALTIDGRAITVKKAVPTRDAQGNIIRDDNGAPKPRFTTIYDAASEAFVRKPGDPHPIPALCHKEHLPPVGVCRVCVVEATEMTRRGPRKKLVPSCVQRVNAGMIVNTINSEADPDAAERVKASCQTVVELLVADHLPDSQQHTTGNELAAIAQRMGVTQSRFAGRSIQRGQDNSSKMIMVDHDQCIMCGRCQRGCNWVKGNNVIGRAEKGYESRIAFDLDSPMGHSHCVSCGECAVSCPTGAMQFQPSFIETQIKRVQDDMVAEKKDGEIVTADELVKIDLFSGIPYKFLQFNGAAVVRRMMAPGDVLCREGEYGSTAFIILDGEFEIFLNTTRGAVRNEKASGLAGLLGGLKTVVEKVGGRARLADVGAAQLLDNQRILRNKEDVVLGEMTCMNRYPRSATVVATQPAEVLEIKRNVLYMLQRNAVSREILDRVYRERSLRGQLASLPIFDSLDEANRNLAADYLSNKADLVSVDPGQTIFKQGDLADDYYINKLGFVKVTQAYGRDERVLNYLGPGNGFGEIGLLSSLGNTLKESLGGEIRPGVRTATCSALDHVELIRIRGDDFRALLQQFPELKQNLAAKAKEILQRDQEARSRLQAVEADEFLDQGLYLAQSLLVLDLERCTRCDECTKACADTHDGVTRLVRDGLRFDKFLVASSCRSCMDPYCLVGCPVDAIHRGGDSLEIEIEDYCIGCGLCAENCPYGNINMHGFDKQEVDAKGKLRSVYQEVDGKKLPVVQQRATTCDLCRSVDGKPSCVYACPHEAAFRMTGKQLMDMVSR